MSMIFTHYNSTLYNSPCASFSVPYFKCSDCDEEVYCDGSDAGLLNMGDFCVSHDLLKDYMKLYLGEGCVLSEFLGKIQLFSLATPYLFVHKE